MNGIINSLILTLTLSFFATSAYSQRCMARTVRTYVRCTDQCKSFEQDPIGVNQLINSCNSKVRFGCKLQLGQCGGFECLHDPAHKFPVCANDDISIPDITTFDETTVGNLELDSANFLVDVVAPPLKVQYYFLVDTSASMAPHLHMVKSKINELVEMYKGMPEIHSSFALGEYRDPRFSGTPRGLQKGMCGLRRIREFTTDASAFQADVHRLSPDTASNSGPEGLLPSIAQVAKHTSGWNDCARKIVIVFGDAPGFEQTKHDLPLIMPLGREHVADYLNEENIVLIGMSIGDVGLDAPTQRYWPHSSRHPPIGGPGQISFIASRTQGVVTSPTKTLLQAVTDAKESYRRVYTMDTSDCEGPQKGLVVNDGTPFRVELKPKEKRTAEISLKVRQPQDFCEQFTCNLTFQEDGIDLVPMSLNFLRINGCS